MVTETFIINEERDAVLKTYIQAVGGEFKRVDKRPAVMVIPGGGYYICSDRESEPVVFAFLKAGFDVFLLDYSVTGDDRSRPHNADWPNPLEDYEQAMRLIRARADEWNIMPDKIAICGFSAGGHLACAAMTMAAEDAKPDAAIVGYPVASEHVKMCNATAPDTISQVKEGNCPCFIFATRDDQVVPIINSIKLMEALAEANVPFESHIYRHGAHGFSTGEEWLSEGDHCPRITDWVEDACDWLKETFDILN